MRFFVALQSMHRLTSYVAQLKTALAVIPLTNSLFVNLLIRKLLPADRQDVSVPLVFY